MYWHYIVGVNWNWSVHRHHIAAGLQDASNSSHGLWKSDAAVWTAVQGYGFFFYACSAHCWFIHALLQLFSPIHKWISHSWLIPSVMGHSLFNVSAPWGHFLMYTVFSVTHDHCEGFSLTRDHLDAIFHSHTAFTRSFSLTHDHHEVLLTHTWPPWGLSHSHATTVRSFSLTHNHCEVFLAHTWPPWGLSHSHMTTMRSFSLTHDYYEVFFTHAWPLWGLSYSHMTTVRSGDMLP